MTTFESKIFDCYSHKTFLIFFFRKISQRIDAQLQKITNNICKILQTSFSQSSFQEFRSLKSLSLSVIVDL